jgi:hypothetical protein
MSSRGNILDDPNDTGKPNNEEIGSYSYKKRIERKEGLYISIERGKYLSHEEG